MYFDDATLVYMKDDFLHFGKPEPREMVCLVDDLLRARREIKVKCAEIEDIRGNNFNLQEEIKRLRTENSELRAKLDVFTEGMPSSDILQRMASEFPVCGPQQWLRRIASANEVSNDKP